MSNSTPQQPLSDEAQDLAARAAADVDRLQVAWQQRDWDAVKALFHPDAMLLPPDLGPTIRSRDAIVASYQDFMAQARVHELTMTNRQVQPFQHSCIVQCAFDIDYSIGEERATDQLTEIYLLERADAALHIVWRAQTLASQ